MATEFTIDQIRTFVKKGYPSVAARMTKSLLELHDGAQPTAIPIKPDEEELQPEEKEVIQLWRMARKAVKAGKFSVAERRIEECIKVIGTPNDYV